MTFLAERPPAPSHPQTPEEWRAYHRFYHEHEEANVAQGTLHFLVGNEVGDILRVEAPHLSIHLDVCCYWVEGSNTIWLGPDVMACDPPGPVHPNRSYRRWDHGAIRLVVEVGSEESRTYDQGAKLARYAEGLRPEEYLYFDPVSDDFRMWEWSGTGYRELSPDPGGRFWSRPVRLWFGREGMRLRVYRPDGTPHNSYEEQTARASMAEARASSAEARASTAEARVVAAEEEAATERREREVAEQALAELAGQIAALKAELAQKEAP